MIEIIPYQPTWHDEFIAIGNTLRQTLGNLAMRIDHIGSTSVPGLAAKDIIDIQITVIELFAPIDEALRKAGFQRVEHITQDHLPPLGDEGPEQWTKWLYKLATQSRPVNVHVRIAGRANQRYALLFKDYLRAQPSVAEAYAQVKSALATYHAEDIDAYYDIKDPVCDVIIAGAERWASETNWKPGNSDC